MSGKIYRDDSITGWDYDPKQQNTLYDSLVCGADHATHKATAMEYYGAQKTYAELLDDIDACAAGLLKLGVKKGDAITIFLPNIPQCLISIYAVSKIGAVCNMLHPQSSKSEFENALNLSQSKIVLTYEINESLCSNRDDITIIRCNVPEYFPKNVKSKILKSAYLYKIRSAKPSVGTKVVEWARVLSDGREAFKAHKEKTGEYVQKVAMDAEDTAMIMYTGGTTGESKGVMLSNRAIGYCMSIIIGENVAGLPHIGDRSLVVLPMFHAYGFILSLHSPICAGICAVLVPKFSPSECAKMILEQKIEYIMGVPSMYERMYPYFEGHDMHYVRQALSGGDTVSVELVEKYNKLLKNAIVDFRQGYGLTEISGGVFVMPATYNSYGEGCVGRLFTGNSLCVVEPGTTNVLPEGALGELCVTGPVLMSGYCNNPEATARVMRKHDDGRVWLHTGDVAEVDNTGLVYFRSRCKRMIKVKGINVYPSVIESVVEKCSVVSKACAVSMKGENGSGIKLFVVLNKLPWRMNAERALEQIKTYSSEHLNEWSQPEDISLIKEMPMTKMQKVDFIALENQA